MTDRVVVLKSELHKRTYLVVINLWLIIKIVSKKLSEIVSESKPLIIDCISSIKIASSGTLILKVM